MSVKISWKGQHGSKGLMVEVSRYGSVMLEVVDGQRGVE